MDKTKTTDKPKVDEKEKSAEPTNGQYVTKAELDTFGASLVMQVSDMFKKQLDVHKTTISQGEAIKSQELGQDPRGIEPVAACDFKTESELEDFMNDKLLIYVHPSPNKEDNPVIVPIVNGVTQPIFRAKKTWVKRKYVEVLARNRVTRFEQKVPDPTKPENFVMQPDTVVKDPFTVHEDPDPRGGPWLHAILSERG